MVGVGVGVVVAGNEPDFGEVENGGEFELQRTLGLDVAEQDDGLRAVRLDAADDELEMTVGVAEEQELGLERIERDG